MVKLANPQSLDRMVPLSSIVWAALEKIGQKQRQSDLIKDGSSHQVSLRIEGHVDGQPFSQTIESILNVGHQQTRSSSVNPQVPEMIAWILSKLNRATRNRILTDIPEEFKTNGGMPESNPVLVDDAKQLLKQLRTCKTVTARGAIRCEYTM